MLGSQPLFILVEAGGSLGRRQPRFQQRGLAILVEVGRGVGNGFRKVAPEAGGPALRVA